MTDENEMRITLPHETYTVMEWEEEGLPVVATVNSALKDFEHKRIFGWHLSLIIDFKEVEMHGMPSEAELKVIEPFCDKLDDAVKAKSNALWLLRETWKKTRRIAWRVYDPKVADETLKGIISSKEYPREFDYYLEQDKEWKEAKWYLDQLGREKLQ